MAVTLIKNELSFTVDRFGGATLLHCSGSHYFQPGDEAAEAIAEFEAACDRFGGAAALDYMVDCYAY